MPDQTQQEQNRAARGSRQNFIFALLSLCVCVTIPATALLGSQGSFGKVNDFPEFYTAAKMSVAGRGAHIYNLETLFSEEHRFFPQMQGRGLGFYIPPFAVPFLGWLSLFSADAAYLAYMALALAAILGSVQFLRRSFALGRTETIWLLCLLCATAPIFESLKLSQLAPFLLFSFSCSLWLAEQKKDLAAGAVLSLLLLKPQELFPLALFWLLSGRLKIIAGLAVAGVFLAAVSALFPGIAAYSTYMQLVRDSASNTIFMQPELSATIRGQLLRIPQLAGAANIISLGTLALSAGSIAWLALVIAKKRIELQKYGLLCAALPLGLVSALHCHDYDLLLLTPWFIAVWKIESTDLLSKATKISAVILFALLVVPFYIPIHYRWLLEQQQIANPIFLAFLSASILSALNYKRTSIRESQATQGSTP